MESAKIIFKEDVLLRCCKMFAPSVTVTSQDLHVPSRKFACDIYSTLLCGVDPTAFDSFRCATNPPDKFFPAVATTNMYTSVDKTFTCTIYQLFNVLKKFMVSIDYKNFSYEDLCAPIQTRTKHNLSYMLNYIIYVHKCYERNIQPLYKIIAPKDDSDESECERVKLANLLENLEAKKLELETTQEKQSEYYKRMADLKKNMDNAKTEISKAEELDSTLQEQWERINNDLKRNEEQLGYLKEMIKHKDEYIVLKEECEKLQTEKDMCFKRLNENIAQLQTHKEAETVILQLMELRQQLKERLLEAIKLVDTIKATNEKTEQQSKAYNEVSARLAALKNQIQSLSSQHDWSKALADEQQRKQELTVKYETLRKEITAAITGKELARVNELNALDDAQKRRKETVREHNAVCLKYREMVRELVEEAEEVKQVTDEFETTTKEQFGVINQELSKHYS